MASETFVLDKDKVRRTDMHFDEVDDTITFNTVQDVGPMLDENRKKMNAYGDKLSLGKRGGMASHRFHPNHCVGKVDAGHQRGHRKGHKTTGSLLE